MSETTVRPYPGARPFLQSEQDRFFGRKDDAATVAQWWRDNKLVFVVGHTGCGKTSLINDARPVPATPQHYLSAAEHALTLGDPHLAELHALVVTRRSEESGHRLGLRARPATDPGRARARPRATRRPAGGPQGN